MTNQSDDGNTWNAGKTVLVFGATGQQGGAVATALRSRGWDVCALVRDPETEKAKALASIGVDLVRGDFSDAGSIRAAMAGAYGVFSVQPSSGQTTVYNVSDEDEIRYGTTIADIAVDLGVKHLVYTSVNAAGPEKTGMGHFDSKSVIEDHIRSLRVPSTIVRPAGFMELLMLPGMGLDQGYYMSFVHPHEKAQLIAVHDIGKIVAGIFGNPDRYIGKTFEIAGSTITGQSLRDSLTQAAGRSISYQRFPDSLLAENDFLRRLVELFDKGRLSGHADIAGLEEEFGQLMSFDAWLAGPGKPLLKAALEAEGEALTLR